MRLRYTPDGLAELDQVLNDIEKMSPQGARNVKRGIATAIDLVLRYPQIGRLTRKRRLRRISASPYPYLIFYQATTDDEIIIHGVRHGARDPRTMPGQQ